MECIDLFSGAGGLTAGLHKAGIKAIAAVEMNKDCCLTYSNTFPDVDLLPDPVQGVNFKKYEGIDLVVGGPPCQPFSTGGKRLADKDERDMLPEFLRAIQEAKPRAFLMENVPGLIGTKHRSYFEHYKAQFEKLGYNLTYSVLNASEYGIPQKRRRLFVVGMLNGQYKFPEPTHGPGRKYKFVPAGRIVKCNTVQGEENSSKVFYAKNPDLRPSPYDGLLFNGGGRAIKLSEPSHTILASAGGNKTHFVDRWREVPPYHKHLVKGGKPRSGALPGGRRLTVLESALLQTFDKGIKFAGSRSSQYTQVGNAVPPRLAKIIGKSIRESLSGN